MGLPRDEKESVDSPAPRGSLGPNMADHATQHVSRLRDLDDDALNQVLELSARLKGRQTRGDLVGRTVGMLFFRGSLRTRASFETAVHQLGGHALNLTAMSDFWELEEREGTVMDGKAPEHIKDAAAALSSYCHALAIRPALAGANWNTDRHDRHIKGWVRHSSVPVINMESALWHPLQALADLLTLRENLQKLEGKTVALCWVHSTEPASPAVAHSLLHAVLRSGMNVRLAHPPGYELDGEVMDEAFGLAGERNVNIQQDMLPEEAVKGADVVYARSWRSLESYGNPTLQASQRSRHTNWRIDEKLFELCPEARLMHAMPVRRNVEITDAVLDSPRSLLYEQAANRLWSQMALLIHLLRS